MKAKRRDRSGADRRPLGENGSGKASPHPLDEWLRRELGSLFTSVQDDPLPPDIAELAGKLEQALTPPGPQKRSE